MDSVSEYSASQSDSVLSSESEQNVEEIYGIGEKLKRETSQQIIWKADVGMHTVFIGLLMTLSKMLVHLNSKRSANIALQLWWK